MAAIRHGREQLPADVVEQVRPKRVFKSAFDEADPADVLAYQLDKDVKYFLAKGLTTEQIRAALETALQNSK
jgi:hypothetical protein